MGNQIPREDLTRWIGFGVGPLAALLIWLLPSFADMPALAQRVAGLATWMAVWWLSSAIPLPATALLPLVMLPLLGVSPMRDVAVRYADPVIFLFMGGFFLAAATERWDLHRRFALAVIGVVGTAASRIVLAFMVATAFASMWISNTATAVMMLPIAAAVVRLALREKTAQARAFGTALMLGVAYSASIGGMATLIGTPPNAIFAGALETMTGRQMGFAEWLVVAGPVAIIMLIVCWFLLTRVLHRVRGKLGGVAEHLASERAALGGWSCGERITAIVFGLAAFAWIFRAPKSVGGIEIPGLSSLLPGLTDAGIAVCAAVFLFVIPVSMRKRRFTLDWETAERVPWGVLLLFGGGLALAAAFDSSGLAQWLGGRLEGLGGVPSLALIAAVALLFIFLTELTSNTATATMGMPVMASVSAAVGSEPVYLMATAAISSSLAFMLPVATPPNAILYGSGAITAGQMARAGIWLNLIGAVVISGAMLLWMK
jgi:sodium-dependent dicarboxylate transporter 2/3/5